jgi:CpeT protein
MLGVGHASPNASPRLGDGYARRMAHTHPRTLVSVLGFGLVAALGAPGGTWLAGAVAGEPPAAPAAPSASSTPIAKASKADLDRLATFMTGVFSSEAQSKRDPENYFPIVLHMAPIWKDAGERDGVKWFYVEQAVATALNRPYRQRVYRLSVQPDGTIRSEIFTLAEGPAALKFAGAWGDESKLAGVTPETIVRRDGCEIALSIMSDGTFKGATDGKKCPSERGGAKYATAEAHIKSDGMVTLDRGYDAQDEQVWGATKGGYEFVKISSDFAQQTPAADGAPKAPAAPAAPSAPAAPAAPSGGK